MQVVSGGPPNLLFNGYWYNLQWVKRLGGEVDHLFPPSDEVKNSWSYIHLLPYTHTWRGQGHLHLRLRQYVEMICGMEGTNLFDA